LEKPCDSFCSRLKGSKIVENRKLRAGAEMLLILAAAGCGSSGHNQAQAPVSTPAPLQGDTWVGYGHDAQHTGLSAAQSQPLQTIRWQTPVDLQPQISPNLLTHYGSPAVTEQNTVIVPVKTGVTDGFRVEAHSGASGALLWTLDSDYSVPTADFTPPFGPALTQGGVAIPAAGGTVMLRASADQSQGTATRLAFYGIDNFNANAAAFTSTVKINTPISADSQGNLFFGFIVSGSNPLNLQSGVARIGHDGQGTWIAAATASADPMITKVSMSCAPALSKDETHLYVSVNNVNSGFGYLLELDATTLQPLNRVRLIDPQSGADATISDSSTAAPTVGPDGDVFYGVLENPFPGHHDRGWLLHFSADLTQQKIPGSFGWDDTASIVPATMVSSYRGTSQYLLMTKYNNYIDVGGDGVNKLAILDPGASSPDSILGNPVMQEVLTIAGQTRDTRAGLPPTAVREWCINTAAVDPFTKSIVANSEDGKLYRWDLTTNLFSQVVTITGGIGEAYTPTVIGDDGTVYAINRAVLFGVGAP
jgi:hypothetical protein